MEYQDLKKSRAADSLYLTDRQVVSLVMSEPFAVNHNDLFEIEVQFKVVSAKLERANIKIEGLFLNVFASFDSKNFRVTRAKKEIKANIYFNNRNGNGDRDEYSDKTICDKR